MVSRCSGGTGPPAWASRLFTARSNSPRSTGAPFTRAMISGSWAGTGFGAAGAWVAAAPVAGVLPALVASAGDFLQAATRATAIKAMAMRVFTTLPQW